MVDVVKYVVKKDDSLWNIMKKNGFPPRDWEKALNAKYNTNFRKTLKREKRKPDLIYAGEVFYLPKYNPAQIEDLVLRLEHQYKLLDNCEQGAKRLNKSLAKIGDDKKQTLRMLKEARDQRKRMDELDNMNFKPDPGDPGRGLKLAKAITQLFDKKRSGLEESIRDLEKSLEVANNKETKQQVVRLQKLSKDMSQNISGVRTEIMKLRAALHKNMKNPY